MSDAVVRSRSGNLRRSISLSRAGMQDTPERCGVLLLQALIIYQLVGLFNGGAMKLRG